ncbi:P110/LppT family adhesin N-terminal domain [Mesomycoplasma ovipneumoniae]|uniref:P110/LppT family adhesin N-terminal domain n=1 Tax=Mesomycoplasma ovipneumoniae TaxID=29562 RepID=UPI0028A78C70|nr:P110/LppT family adhesin N-terminal domain [Mesomycoplasma ovipneumoniae]WNM16791.1 P110/LppT family adhesin N-terminal domain [Mesomycoplasma ovipneumoniae]
MKLLKKPFWLVSTILGSAIALSAVIGIPLGLKAYNNSYYSFLNESPTEHALANTGSVSSEQFSTIVSNLKLNPNIANISAKTALAAAKSKLYQFDLSSGFDFGDLKSKDYQISFNFENAVVEGNSIKNVVVFARSEKEQITYSKQIELKGFAASDQASGDLDKFQVDESKSFIDVSRSNLLQAEFQNKLKTNFQKSTRIVNNFSKLEGSLASSGASLSLYNSLDEPIFLDSDYSLEAVVDSKNQLSFTEKDKKLFLDVNLVNKKDNKTKKLSLEIRGLIDPDEFKSTLSTWLENHFSGQIKMKEVLQEALIKDKTTLVDFLYNKKSGTNTEDIIKKPVSELFEIDLSQLSPRTKFGTFDLKIEPKLFDSTKISQADQQKLLKDKKVRFEFDINFSRQDNQLEQKITVYLDVVVDLNKYEQALGQLLGSVNSVQEFSLKDQSGPRTLSTNEIKETVDQLFELAKTTTNLEDPSDEVVSRVFLLDNGRFPTRSEINKSKNELKKVIQEAKAKASSISSQSVNVSNFAEEESTTTTSESGTATNSTGDSSNGSAGGSGTNSGGGSTPAPESTPAPNPTPEPAPKIGTNVWTTLNTASIYNLSDAKVEYQIEVKEDHQLVFDFQLVSTNDDSKVLASSQIVVNNVINSEKSAYDVIKKYNPSLFLDPISLENTDKDGKVNLFDPENKNLAFHSEQARRTADGLELTKPLKFQDIQPKDSKAEATKAEATKPEASKTEATKTEATKTEAAKPVAVKTTEATKTEATKPEAILPKVSAKPFSRLDSGALYLAFSAKGISDGKQHYLLSDKDGKGIFIQKLETKENQKPVYVIGMDYKQFANYAYSKHLLGRKKPGTSGYIQIFGGSDSLKILDKKQVLIASGISRKDTTKSNNRLTNPALKQSSYLYGSWDFGLVPATGEMKNKIAQKTELFINQPDQLIVPTIGDIPNNVYFRQSFFLPKEDTNIEKNNNLIEEDANLLLEIIKTPFSVTLSLYSSNSQDPKNYKEVGDVIYNIDRSKTWNPFPNFFNLDWAQIGPVESVPASPAIAAAAAPTQADATSSTAAPENQPQTDKSGKSQSTITLKAFAVFDHPDFTNGKTSLARQEITEAFIDTYIKK